MGGWGLEVCKMGMYMTFPVALFYFFNQPAYFEEWVTNKKRELYPPESKGHRKEIEEAIRQIRDKQDQKIMKALEDIDKKKL